MVGFKVEVLCTVVVCPVVLFLFPILSCVRQSHSAFCDGISRHAVGFTLQFQFQQLHTV